MVVFRDGKPYKTGYRKFKMQTVPGTDDYASLAETVSRRAAAYERVHELAAHGQASEDYFGEKPDLLLMDGGKGQVSAAKAALAGTKLADVPLFGMVKDDHHRTRAIVDSDGREIAINMNRGTFTFITAIQDETHRFANAYRKQQMKKKELRLRPDRGARRGAENSQGADEPVQERGCGAGSQHRSAGEYARCGAAVGADHLRVFSHLKECTLLRAKRVPEKRRFFEARARIKGCSPLITPNKKALSKKSGGAPVGANAFPIFRQGRF